MDPERERERRSFVRLADVERLRLELVLVVPAALSIMMLGEDWDRENIDLVGLEHEEDRGVVVVLVFLSFFLPLRVFLFVPPMLDQLRPPMLAIDLVVPSIDLLVPSILMSKLRVRNTGRGCLSSVTTSVLVVSTFPPLLVQILARFSSARLSGDMRQGFSSLSSPAAPTSFGCPCC